MMRTLGQLAIGSLCLWGAFASSSVQVAAASGACDQACELCLTGPPFFPEGCSCETHPAENWYGCHCENWNGFGACS